MTLQEHAEAIKAAVAAAEAAGFTVGIQVRSCGCCNEGVWIEDQSTGQEEYLDID
jgi:hypothetical protein